MSSQIYLDNNASTAVDPQVLQAVVQDLHESIGNASSIHAYGQAARNKVSAARRVIADFLHVRPQEIIFTSGGTEGVNMLIQGVIDKGRSQGKNHVISSAAEHACVYNTLKHLQERGTEVSFLSPGLWGAVTPQEVKDALRPDTALITLMAVNNETGVKTDIEQIAAIAEEAKVPFVVDAIALLGKEPFSIPKGVSAMIFSGHKIHAPKGVGAVFVRSSLKFTPLLFGGSQEMGRRPGSENVPGIVGLGEAVSLLQPEVHAQEMARLRDRLEAGLKSKIPGLVINGEGPRVCNTSNISFMGMDGETLLMQLDRAGVAVSHGSACVSGALEPSRILLNMGLSLERARSAIRFSLSRFTTEDEIDSVIDIITNFFTTEKTRRT